MKKKHLHFVGIKGVGMTALAIYCKERGFEVSGCDLGTYFHTEKILSEYSIPVYDGFDKKHIKNKIDKVIFSGAYSSLNNADLIEAEKRGIKRLNHGQALGLFMSDSKSISVAGTHGKTTISAIIATILTAAGLDPSYVIGAPSIKNLKTSGHYGKGEYFIAEADEYKSEISKRSMGRFLWQHPEIAIISNIDYDHPDVFENFSDVRKTFKQFINNIKPGGLLIYNNDDKQIKKIINNNKIRKISFGKTSDSTYRLLDSKIIDRINYIKIQHNNNTVSFKLNIYGEHNCLNVTAAYALADLIGIDTNVIEKSLMSYQGSKRRFEYIKNKEDILYYDDYAHHPTAIRKTLSSFKLLFPNKRLVVIFQPHTYSRTKALLTKFAKSFNSAALVILVDIYATARENKVDFKVTSTDLKDKLVDEGQKAYYATNMQKVLQYLDKHAQKGDIVITMGAGDIHKLHDLI